MTDSEDNSMLEAIKGEILAQVGGLEKLRLEFPRLIRRAIDEVIDTPRTARLTINQVEKTEKTYIGTKIEILFRNLLKIPKGILDLEINGIDVDIKNTVTGNWMIPSEAFDKPCILITSDEKTALCSLGLIICRSSYLTAGKNRDGKKNISAEGKKNIKWIIKDQPYPKNFWEITSPEIIEEVMAGKTANQRLISLFTKIQNTAISRQVVEGVARQKDYMKRLRKNGGARDDLSKAGIAVLSGNYDKNLIENLGLLPCAADEFVSFRAQKDNHIILLKDSGHL